MITAMLLLFVMGYILIALEHKINISKTAIALILGIALWVMYIFAGGNLTAEAASASFHNFISQNPDYQSLSLAAKIRKYITGSAIAEQLGNISEILFYLLGALTIVEAIDTHQGFSIITNKIKTKNKRKLLWLVTGLTFLMSSVLDNMTSAIVMMILVQKILEDRQERWIFGSTIILAANAGGAWTPIGDVTTIMLWIHENISSGGIMKTIFFPSVVSVLLPAWILSLRLKGQLSTANQGISTQTNSPVNKHRQNNILMIGILCLLAVPVLKSTIDLPPFAGVLLSLGLLWVYLDMFYNRQKSTVPGIQYRLPVILSKVDFSTILFFLGILLAVAALEGVGVLHQLSDFLNNSIHNIYGINLLIGILSSVVDNVPLVAAAMGMYPITSPQLIQNLPEAHYLMNFVHDGSFWNLLAYSTGTGGSLLIIGSAAGVVVMGLEKISFTWYLKNITWIALSGFLAGTGIFYLQTLL